MPEVKTLQASEGTTITAPTLLAVEIGNLGAYASEAAFVAAKGSAAATGDTFFDTGASLSKIYNGSSWTSTSLGIGLNTDTHTVGDADYLILDGDGYRHILVGSSTLTAGRTITLPTASDNTDRIITIKKIDTSAFVVTIDGEGAETIDGVTTTLLSTQYDAVTLLCDGTSWSTIVFGAATATQSGLIKAEKQYVHGTDFTVTSTSAGTEVFSRGVAVPYQTYDGAWRMKFNIQFTHDADGAYTITIPDVVFKNVTDYRQMVGFMGSNSSYSGRVFTNPNTATISVQTNTSNTETSISGDVELNSKPTWAD